VGYFFMKSGEDLWSAFAFHGTMNAFNVSLPVYLGSGYQLQSLIATVTTFAILVLLLHLRFRKPLNESTK
jgi:membrane protease YdiL (CAAX protease family)